MPTTFPTFDPAPALRLPEPPAPARSHPAWVPPGAADRAAQAHRPAPLRGAAQADPLPAIAEFTGLVEDGGDLPSALDVDLRLLVAPRRVTALPEPTSSRILLAVDDETVRPPRRLAAAAGGLTALATLAATAVRLAF